MTQTFVIIGAGQAGSWIARTLRADGVMGRIVMIGAEPHLPYERPPLSKAILNGTAGLESATLLTKADAVAQRIEHWPNAVAQTIDPVGRTVRLEDGREIAYTHLFLATGSAPRTLKTSAHDLGSDRLHVLRTLDDALTLRAALQSSKRLAVIGGGWIGLEVAATARQMGLDVVVIEAGPRLCARSVPVEVSNFLVALHRREGVAVAPGVTLGDILPDGDCLVVSGHVEDGGETRFIVDQVVIGIGVTPVTQLAETAGLCVENGIVVDEFGRTSDPAIWAAGDVTNQPSAFSGAHVRLESWANAQNQAVVAARAAQGHAVRHNPVPWIWSDQFGVNIQIAGSPERAAALILRGDPLAGSGCWLGLDDAGQAIGAVCVNGAREMRVVRKALERLETPDPHDWANSDVPVNKMRVYTNLGLAPQRVEGSRYERAARG